MKNLVTLVAGLALGVPLRLFGAFVLSKYWQWFAVEHIGLKPISYLACVAVLMIWGFFMIGLDVDVGRVRSEVAKEERDSLTILVESVVTWIVLYPLLLLLGWLWHWGMS